RILVRVDGNYKFKDSQVIETTNKIKAWEAGDQIPEYKDAERLAKLFKDYTASDFTDQPGWTFDGPVLAPTSDKHGNGDPSASSPLAMSEHLQRAINDAAVSQQEIERILQAMAALNDQKQADVN